MQSIDKADDIVETVQRSTSRGGDGAIFGNKLFNRCLHGEQWLSDSE
jgi:hypothetical protein